MIRKEKIISHIKSHGGMYTFLSFILTLLMVIYQTRDIIGRIIAKVTSEILIIAIIVSFFGTIISFIFWLRQRWMNSLKRKERDLSAVKSELESKTKQLEEKTKQDGELVKKFQLGFARCEIETDESGDNPKLLITQRFFNIFVESLKLSKVEIMLKANGIELDEFVYNPPSRVQQLGNKIKTSSTKDLFPEPNLECWIRFETTKLSQVIPDYHGNEIRIDVEGVIEFTRGTAKISKEIVDGRSVKFKPKPYPPVY